MFIHILIIQGREKSMRETCENCERTLIPRVHKQYTQHELIAFVVDELEGGRHVCRMANACEEAAKIIRSFIKGIHCKHCGWVHEH
jgi:hypothetical protein